MAKAWVAMESTGSYWVGLYFFLEEKGFDVLLANAKDVKNVSGKKTGEAYAESVCTGVSQVVDIPLPRPQVKEHRSFDVTCSCGHINKCPLPKECSKRICIGK